MQIILGSSSPFRQRVFAKVSEYFSSMSPEIDEQAIRDADPKTLTRKLAHAKADALVSRISEPALLVTADQVVVVNGEIREKPSSEEEARVFLRSYSEQPVAVVNGVVVTNTETGRRAEGNDTVHIHFRTIPESIIDQLIAEGEVLRCAGALKGEHRLLADYIEFRDGADESLQGVPVDLIKKLMNDVQT